MKCHIMKIHQHHSKDQIIVIQDKVQEQEQWILHLKDQEQDLLKLSAQIMNHFVKDMDLQIPQRKI